MAAGAQAKDPIRRDIVRTARGHRRRCLCARAVRARVGIECPHGYDVCPACDPCTCGKEEEKP